MKYWSNLSHNAFWDVGQLNSLCLDSLGMNLNFHIFRLLFATHSSIWRFVRGIRRRTKQQTITIIVRRTDDTSPINIQRRNPGATYWSRRAISSRILLKLADYVGSINNLIFTFKNVNEILGKFFWRNWKKTEKIREFRSKIAKNETSFFR